ncbi:hypothetical protein ATE84_2614 [Aquimarina sp. MAR_2010_214]|uniref:hypothetical protein n=1 Tax=Aquimarina sp. MAR_2010_214 TaxID=1250026 RepID=UPI000C6FF29B|nr:hypothetical protein [Aquimarina sp. MAR_2010_214]PKV50555.1 hypothetical protein ATE84_2614 [Aquimarina sp. MAR_2010_214]
MDNNLKIEKTKIIQCCVPPLVSGNYSVDVKQKVSIKNGSNKETINKTFNFAVDAARFSLNPTDIYSVHPPANQYGNYTELLPHVVFTRRTLPWERTIDGKIPEYLKKEKTSAQKNPPVPWMALLLFDEDEMKDITISNNILSDVIQPKKEDLIIQPKIYPKAYDSSPTKKVLKLQDWENEDDTCLTIDITWEQFKKYAPSKKSLPYTAHAKEVEILHKDQEGITDLNEDGEGVFAVVVGNRLPTPSKSHTAILISLEGHQELLEKDNIKEKKVRLVVLAHWNFTNSGETTFSQLVENLGVKSMKIEKDESTDKVKDFFEDGYMPLEHLTRSGATIISWYHGPFLPKFFPYTSENNTFISSDTALRYDKETGFFDISFAAAWQLGRMLALQNQGFSNAMLTLVTQQKKQQIYAEKEDFFKKILEHKDESTKTPIVPKEMAVNYLAKKIGVEIVKPKTVLQQAKLDNKPQEITDFLGELYKLKGVPFSYLIPHEKYLIKEGNLSSETLSLFYVDPYWVEALLDGALSIGRINNRKELLTEAMSGTFIKEYTEQILEEVSKTEEDIEGTEVKRLNTTGFLLRSDLVSGWRGIEIKAYDNHKNILPALRFQRIDKDIFLGVFHGVISTIEIKQPYEGLHFGVNKVNDEYHKNLKNENKKHDDNGRNRIITSETLNINEELTKKLIKDNVLDIAGLASTMQEKLQKKNWLKSQEGSNTIYFTSSEFTFQMVNSPIKATINVKIEIN